MIGIMSKHLRSDGGGGTGRSRGGGGGAPRACVGGGGTGRSASVVSHGEWSMTCANYLPCGTVAGMD